jgi:2-polyprenyl-3-methyl-5-hydroxy-6-metoxy-1,4-benzoquinol methylase
MIREPAYTLEFLKATANHSLNSKDGYQWYDIDTANRRLRVHANSKSDFKAKILKPKFQALLPGCTVMDLGCDKGYFSWLAVEAGATHVLAVDVKPELKRYLDNLVSIMKWPIEPINQNLFTTEFDRKVDYVLALAMLHEIKQEIGATIRRIRSLCTCGAIIEFCEDYSEEKGWNREEFESLLSNTFRQASLIDRYRAISTSPGWRYLYECLC